MILAHAARAGHSPWGWHPHLDVWALVALLVGSYVFAVRRLGPRLAPDGRAITRRQLWLFGLGIAALWLASDWPVHDVAEGFMYSVHMVQHLVLSLVVPPLLILGTPPWLLRFILRPIRPVFRQLVRPIPALLAFNVTVALTHWTPLVDAALRSGAAHFGQHVLVVVTAALMWWPVVSPLPELGRLHPAVKMGYLFLQSLVPTVPASFLTWGSHPLYHSYEAFPKLWGLSAGQDQQIAGLIMKMGGGFILWGAIIGVFFRWAASEEPVRLRRSQMPRAPDEAATPAVR